MTWGMKHEMVKHSVAVDFDLLDRLVSDETIHRRAMHSIESASAATSISIGSAMLCFYSGFSDSGAPQRMF